MTYSEGPNIVFSYKEPNSDCEICHGRKSFHIFGIPCECRTQMQEKTVATHDNEVTYPKTKETND